MDSSLPPVSPGGLCLIPLEEGIPRCFFPHENSATYLEHAADLKSTGGRFLGLWASASPFPRIYSSVLLKEGLILMVLSLGKDAAGDFVYPSLSRIFPSASRFERTVRDLFGFIPAGLEDQRPWVDHAHWSIPPLSVPPGTRISSQTSSMGRPDYPFVRVKGPGIHEIPVGPVHAGIIEPGHFRFQVLGEKILRVEERLGYAHKGVDGLFRGRTIMEGAKLAARISGDSTVAHSLAFAQAVEQALDFIPAAGVRFMRAFLLERERLMNHLGDLGAIGNDAGLAFALSQFGRLKEELLRKNHLHFGSRYLFDLVRPGGIAIFLGDPAIRDLLTEIARLLEEVLELQRIYDDHGGLQDRFQNTGILSPEIATRMGIGGVVGRASAQAWDLRSGHRCDPYHRFPPALALAHTGDVAARVRVRFLEIQESLFLSRALLEHFPENVIKEEFPINPDITEGIGIIEGFRGETVSWVRLSPGGIIQAAHHLDPSAILWPALEMAVPGNLVADFPLINKSFNLSYSGNDL